MKLYVPDVGDVIELTQDWTFQLFNDQRNESVITYFDKQMLVRYLAYWQADKSEPVTIPSGAVLKIDRVYIRKGNSEFSSLSFFWLNADGTRKRLRFWAKLADVNTIEFKQVDNKSKV